MTSHGSYVRTSTIVNRPTRVIYSYNIIQAIRTEQAENNETTCLPAIQLPIFLRTLAHLRSVYDGGHDAITKQLFTGHLALDCLLALGTAAVRSSY